MAMTRRELGTTGLMLALGAVGTKSLAAPITAAPAPDLLRYVAPELRPVATMMLANAAAGKVPTLSPATLTEMRVHMDGYARPVIDSVPVVKRVIPGSAGSPPVTLYTIGARTGAAPAAALRGAILHTHGGGFVMGTARASIGSLQQLALATDAVIVSVEYRLAPETGFAGSVADNYAGLRWLHANAASLGVDPKRIAVMGESAGGGHAALLAIAARDRGEVPVAFQCLLYPMLDDRTGSTRAVPDHIGNLIWKRRDNVYGWRSLLGVEPGSAAVPAAGVPARVKSVAGLPPAFIGVGSIDLFVEEDVAFASRLIGAGVATELLVVPGAFHAFDAFGAGTSIERQFTAAKIAALRRALAA